MTSEGQHAGQQPRVTSGSGAGQFGTDGFPPDAFPPDADGQQTADRAPSYPVSYTHLTLPTNREV